MTAAPSRLAPARAARRPAFPARIAPLFTALLALAGLALAAPAVAQPTVLCSTCLAEAHCQADAEACVPSCQARYFSIDPRRRDCMAQCDTTRAQCERAALTTCRQRQACR